MADSCIGHKEFNAKLAAITVKSEASTRRRTSSKRSGQYLDSPDLAKKYEGKPEQLKNVRERTEKTYCKTRGTTLYKNPEYVSDDEDESARVDSWARVVEAAEPKPKRPKPDGQPKPQGGPKALTEPQRHKVKKGSDTIVKDCAALQETMKAFDGAAADYLPAPARKTHNS